MEMVKGAILTSDHLQDFYNYIDSNINSMSSSIINVYDLSNNLYNNSTAMEDILLNNLTTFYNKINSITFSYTGSSVIINESFKSTEYVDKKFKVDKNLNIDSDNRTLTLAVKGTENIQISSVLIEPDSNGSPGNSLQKFQNSNIESIFDKDNGTIFEYEKYTSSFDSANLNLTLTLKLASKEIINNLYIKLYAGSNSNYASISSISVSNDTVTWKNLDNFIDSGDITQNDHFIRFTSIKVEYIRIIFTQNVAEVVNTNYGIKNRYSIGIRDISVYRSEFDDTGDYVSIPFEPGFPIKKISLTSQSINNNDIKFFFSANNGGKWLEITPNTNTTTNLLELDTGVMLPENLRTIRIRINIVRKASQDVNNITQTFQVNNSNTYILKYAPLSLKAFIGGHISYGDMIKYNISMPSPFNILNELYMNSGYKIIVSQSTTGNNYTVTNNRYSLDNLVIGTSQTLDGALDIVDSSIYTFLGKNYVQTLKYVPYIDKSINDNLDVIIGAETIDRYSLMNDTYYIISRIVRHPNYMHSFLFLDLDNTCQFYKVNEETDVITNINIGESLPTTTTTGITTNSVYLIYCSNIENKSDFYVAIEIDGSDTMYGRFSAGNLGDFASDARIECIDPTIFNSTIGDPGQCNSGGELYTKVIKVTFENQIKIGMYINFGYNTDEMYASNYYVSNTINFPPYPWDDGPADNEKYAFSVDTVDMNNCCVLTPSSLNASGDTVYYIDYYTYLY